MLKQEADALTQNNILILLILILQKLTAINLEAIEQSESRKNKLKYVRTHTQLYFLGNSYPFKSILVKYKGKETWAWCITYSHYNHFHPSSISRQIVSHSLRYYKIVQAISFNLFLRHPLFRSEQHS